MSLFLFVLWVHKTLFIRDLAVAAPRCIRDGTCASCGGSVVTYTEFFIAGKMRAQGENETEAIPAMDKLASIRWRLCGWKEAPSSPCKPQLCNFYFVLLLFLAVFCSWSSVLHQASHSFLSFLSFLFIFYLPSLSLFLSIPMSFLLPLNCFSPSLRCFPLSIPPNLYSFSLLIFFFLTLPGLLLLLEGSFSSSSSSVSSLAPNLPPLILLPSSLFSFLFLLFPLSGALSPSTPSPCLSFLLVVSYRLSKNLAFDVSSIRPKRKASAEWDSRLIGHSALEKTLTLNPIPTFL